MSTLHNRIMTQGQDAPEHKPYGTPQTPMTMPVAAIVYDQSGLYYEDLHPVQLITGDVNAAPVAATAPGEWGQVHAAGRA